MKDSLNVIDPKLIRLGNTLARNIRNSLRKDLGLICPTCSGPDKNSRYWREWKPMCLDKWHPQNNGIDIKDSAFGNYKDKDETCFAYTPNLEEIVDKEATKKLFEAIDKLEKSPSSQDGQCGFDSH